jgi:outer membrane protein TolC
MKERVHFRTGVTGRWKVSHAVVRALLGLSLGTGNGREVSAAAEGADSPDERVVSLRECVSLALQNNRELQIQRLVPQIARATLSGSYGHYDPVFLADTRRESASDTGGLDPTDFSRDAVYTADSVTSRLGLTGFLPTGLSYSLAGSYANSDGLRNSFDFESYSVAAAISVRQPLLRNAWVDAGRWVIQVNKRNLRITELGVVYLAMDVVNRVQQAYYDLLQAREQVNAREQLLAARRQTLQGERRKVEKGLLTPPDLLATQTQVALTEADLHDLRNVVALAENNLRNLLGEDPRTQPPGQLRPTDSLNAVPEIFDLRESWEQGLARRPDLAQLREDVAKSELDAKYRRNQLFPALDLVAGYGRRGASTAQLPPPLDASASASEAFEQLADGTAPSDFVGVIFSLPLSRTSERAAYRASKELRAQAELLVKQREELILREIADAVSTAQASLQRVRAAQQATGFAQQAIEAEERKLAGGKSTLFFVLQVQNDLAAARAAEVNALGGYGKALSQLRFAEARILEQHGLSIEFD